MGAPRAFIEPLFFPPAWPITALIIALLGGLLIYTVIEIVKLVLVPFTKGFPVVGGWVSSHIEGLANTVAGAIKSWAEGQLTPLIQTIGRVQNRLARFTRANTLAHQASLAALRRIRYDDLPRVQTAVIDFVQARIADVMGALRADTQRALDYTSQVQQSLSQYIGERADQLWASVLQIRDQLLEQDRREAGYAEQLTQQAIARADSEVERATRAAQAEDAAIVAWSQQLAHLQLSYTQQQVAKTQQYARLLSQQDNAYTLAVGGALELAIGGLGAFLGGRITAIENSDCQRNCAELGKIARQTNAIDLVLLLAATAAMIARPVESATVADTLLEPVIQPALAITQRVLGY